MLNNDNLDTYIAQQRGADNLHNALGVLSRLSGKWRSLPGHGWNMIPLPYHTKSIKEFEFRLFLNQYDEELSFTPLDGPVPNRGFKFEGLHIKETDQFIAPMRYEQKITQLAASDYPDSGLASKPGSVIHEEVGMWLHLTNQAESQQDLVRMATVPHGDTVLALGGCSDCEGAPEIEGINGLPIGTIRSLHNIFLKPYKHFHEQPFLGEFDPCHPNAFLNKVNEGVKIKKTTAIKISTKNDGGGVNNIPFIIKQAKTSEMESTLWIQELDATDEQGNSQIRLQYSQLVYLEFFPSIEGGRIRWPHVSINTLVPA
jgi:hypothetical protein